MSPRKPATKRVSVRTTDRPAPPSPSLRLYRRLAFGFVAVVVVLLAIVVYVSTVQAVIRVTPTNETVKIEFLLDVVRAPTGENEIRGRVLSGTLNRTATYTPSGEGMKEVVGVAKGIVTLHNETGLAQPLVRTTRLLAPDGTLFRLDATVSVPAQGTVQVAVYADQKGKTGDVAPAKFTIPGLYPEKQKLVYATSEKAFTGGFGLVSAIGQADIDRAVNDLKEKLTADIKTALRKEVDPTLEGESYAVDVSAQKTSVPIGTQAANFDLTMTVRISGVFYDKKAVQELAARHLFQSLPPGKRFADVHAAGLQSTVDKVDLKGEKANIRVYMDGRAIPAANSAGLDPARFAGMSAEEVKKALMADGLAASVEVKFTPAFIRHVPRLKDHIIVEIVP